MPSLSLKATPVPLFGTPRLLTGAVAGGHGNSRSGIWEVSHRREVRTGAALAAPGAKAHCRHFPAALGLRERGQGKKCGRWKRGKTHEHREPTQSRGGCQAKDQRVALGVSDFSVVDLSGRNDQTDSAAAQIAA